MGDGGGLPQSLKLLDHLSTSGTKLRRQLCVAVATISRQIAAEQQRALAQVCCHSTVYSNRAALRQLVRGLNVWMYLPSISRCATTSSAASVSYICRLDIDREVFPVLTMYGSIVHRLHMNLSNSTSYRTPSYVICEKICKCLSIHACLQRFVQPRHVSAVPATVDGCDRIAQELSDPLIVASDCVVDVTCSGGVIYLL